MRLIGVVVVLCALSAGIFQAEAAVTVRKPGYTLTLPDGWVEMPREVVAAVSDVLRQQMPNAKTPRYDSGFQPGSVKEWMQDQYILVQVINDGRIQMRQLKALSKVDLDREVKKQMSGQSFITNTKMGQPWYDEAAHVVWFTLETNVVGAGKIRGISGLIPTERGGVQVHAYARDADFDKNLPVFRQIITSTAIPTELAYKPRWTDSLPGFGGINWDSVQWSAVVGGIAGGIGGALVIILKRFQSRKNVG